MALIMKIKKIFEGMLLMIGILSVPLMAEDTKPEQTQVQEIIPRRLLFGNPIKTSPKLSPDSSKMAYLAPDENEVLNVWLKDLTKDEPDQKITADHKRGVRYFFWQADGQHINYLQDTEGDENWHLFQTDLATRKTRELTPFAGVKVNIIEYSPQFPNEMLIGMNKRDPSVFDVYRLNLKTGEIQLELENPDAVIGWTADHQLQVRVAESYTKDGSTLIRVRENANSPWKELLTISPLDSGSVVGFAPDGNSLYILTNVDGNTERLFQVDIATGKPKLLVEDPYYDLSSVVANPITHQLEFVEVEKERSEWIILDPNLKADFDYLDKNLKTPFILTSRDLANQNWIVASVSDIRPSHFYLYNRAQKKLSFLFSTQPALEKYTLSAMQPITFQARDGMKLHGYLTLPAGQKPKNLPAIIFVHGGPWVRDSWGFNPTVQWLANRGYAVLQINYRGSTGYGKQYLNAGNREWGKKMQTDLLDGKNWLIQQGYANPQKVALLGGSYGGYATLAGLAFTPNEYCCGVDIVGPSNLITLLQTMPPYWGPLKAQNDIRLGSLDSEKDIEFLKSLSPLFKADAINKPLLIGQGANDPRVKQSESDQIVQAMRKKNLPVEYLLFPDEGHGFARPENRLKFNAAAEEFLSKYLGGKLEAPSSAENWESLRK